MMGTGAFGRTNGPAAASHPAAVDGSSQLVGRRGTPFRMRIEEGKVAEFHAATHTPMAAGAGPTAAPLTFLASCLLWMAPENSPWFGAERDFRRILHGEQEFAFPSGPLAVGTELTAQQRIDAVYRKTGAAGGMTFTDLATDFWTDDPDRPVATARSVSITMDRMPEPSPGAPVAPPRVPDGFDLIGEVVESAYTITDFVRYQGASGDFNPIHHDADFARAAGYPTPFAVGMLAAGIAAGLVTRHVDIAAVRRFRVRWSVQAWPHEAITFRVSRAPDRFHVLATRPDGRTHMTAWADLGSLPASR